MCPHKAVVSEQVPGNVSGHTLSRHITPHKTHKSIVVAPRYVTGTAREVGMEESFLELYHEMRIDLSDTLWPQADWLSSRGLAHFELRWPDDGALREQYKCLLQKIVQLWSGAESSSDDFKAACSVICGYEVHLVIRAGRKHMTLRQLKGNRRRYNTARLRRLQFLHLPRSRKMGPTFRLHLN
jgi:hypothetical protein